MTAPGVRAVVGWVQGWDQDTLDYLGSLQMAGGAAWKRSEPGKPAEPSHVEG